MSAYWINSADLSYWEWWPFNEPSHFPCNHVQLELLIVNKISADLFIEMWLLILYRSCNPTAQLSSSWLSDVSGGPNTTGESCDLLVAWDHLFAYSWVWSLSIIICGSHVLISDNILIYRCKLHIVWCTDSWAVVWCGLCKKCGFCVNAKGYILFHFSGLCGCSPYFLFHMFQLSFL